ncbi:hypothetical protein B0J11DRAFT_513255 [Dendryphion nanum]|uniref:Secreted protein n=1 Tax=Dendryphion nanum TaxID=256645 RepID=A0A9P9IY20_9PLEO|nr:hypothetical protein B0J11DRAFT_513255 [Dendryphion nanum]
MSIFGFWLVLSGGTYIHTVHTVHALHTVHTVIHSNTLPISSLPQEETHLQAHPPQPANILFPSPSWPFRNSCTTCHDSPAHLSSTHPSIHPSIIWPEKQRMGIAL